MKTLRNLAALGACLTVVGLLAGCGNSATSVAPNTPMTQSSADDFAVQAVATMSVSGGDVDGAISSTPSASARVGRVFPNAALWDTTYTGSNGFTYSASRTFYDADDNALSGWSPAAVRLHRTSTASGTVEGSRDTVTVGHSGVMDIRGIQSGQDTLRVDGACLDTLINSFRSLDGLRTRHFHWTSSLALEAVKILKSAQTGRPFAGTVTLVVAADRLRSSSLGDVEAHFNATIVIVFHDGAPADISIDSSYHYLWNLQTGAIARA